MVFLLIGEERQIFHTGGRAGRQNVNDPLLADLRLRMNDHRLFVAEEINALFQLGLQHWQQLVIRAANGLLIAEHLSVFINGQGQLRR